MQPHITFYFYEYCKALCQALQIDTTNGGECGTVRRATDDIDLKHFTYFPFISATHKAAYMHEWKEMKQFP